METGQHQSAIKLLEDAAAEFARINRGSDYGLWHQETSRRLNIALEQVTPFKDFCDVWIYTGGGGGIATVPRFGEWAIRHFLKKTPPDKILEAFSAEVARNEAVYTEVLPIFGVQIDEDCKLSDTISIVPDRNNELISLLHLLPRQLIPPHSTCSLLYLSFTVTPAFKRNWGTSTKNTSESLTVPEASHRAAASKRIRLACLLANKGSVEIPFTVLRPAYNALFVAGEGNLSGRPYAAYPPSPLPIQAVVVRRIYESLEKFRNGESLVRSIERLGRARIAVSPVDRALELGIAAEIALMHDNSPTNAEITYKIGSRAAWLLGRDHDEREAIFLNMKKLYQARSQAVHSGTLSPKSSIDLDAADRLVARVLIAILERGSFPDWNNLTMGGDGQNREMDDAASQNR